MDILFLTDALHSLKLLSFEAVICKLFVFVYILKINRKLLLIIVNYYTVVFQDS